MNYQTISGKAPKSTNGFENSHKNWIAREKLAIEMLGIAADLWYGRSVELVIFRRSLIDNNPSEILNNHLRAQEIINKELDVGKTIMLVRGLKKLDLAPSRIDLGRLGSEWLEEQHDYEQVTDFLAEKLHAMIGAEKIQMQPKDIILYGFGRIGRLATRSLISNTGKGEQLRLRAIVTRNTNGDTLAKRAELLRNDSIHGPFDGTILVDEEKQQLIINGQPVHMINAAAPDKIDYTQYGIRDALVIDNTGVWRDRDGLGRHLEARGVDKVLLTAPGKGDVPNVVYGINEESHLEDERIFSAASCTTNAIVPVLKVLDDALGIRYGHIESVHSYTNDQNLLDNIHKKYRRGRAAALNMVITETGAGTAVAKALPNLTGKLTGNAVRVPTPNGSLAIINLTFDKKTDKQTVNKLLKDASMYGNLMEQIEYSENNELVSCDIIGSPHASIVDSAATIIAPSGNNGIFYIWYDNEYGYTQQVIRFAKHLAHVRRLTYY